MEIFAEEAADGLVDGGEGEGGEVGEGEGDDDGSDHGVMVGLEVVEVAGRILDGARVEEEAVSAVEPGVVLVVDLLACCQELDGGVCDGGFFLF